MKKIWGFIFICALGILIFFGFYRSQIFKKVALGNKIYGGVLGFGGGVV